MAKTVCLCYIVSITFNKESRMKPSTVITKIKAHMTTLPHDQDLLFTDLIYEGIVRYKGAAQVKLFNQIFEVIEMPLKVRDIIWSNIESLRSYSMLGLELGVHSEFMK